MASKTVVRDDIDGSQGALPRTFAVGGTNYEIDLTDINYARMLHAFEPYRSRARVAPTKKAKRVNYAPLVNKEDRASIRAWAIANGRYVATRGRLPQDLIRDYYATIAQTPQAITRLP